MDPLQIEKLEDFMREGQGACVPDGLTPEVTRFHFKKFHRSTWVCLTCFTNVDAVFRKQHAMWHSLQNHRHYDERISPSPSQVHGLTPRGTQFIVFVAHCDGKTWIDKCNLI